MVDTPGGTREDTGLCWRGVNTMSEANRPVLLTGDTPTGALHLGHWVGSLQNRVQMQEQGDCDCYFLLANTHAFTTRAEQPQAIYQSVMDIVLDYLAAGIDPERATVFVESDVPGIFELATWLSMLIPFPRLMRNPTIKDEIRDKQLGDQYSCGFLWYPILQVADILAVRATVVPVGEDQIPHLEMTREVARRFNQMYCGVDPHAPDEDHCRLGGLFPVPALKLGRVKRLVGLGGPNEQGQLLKMSKSLNNAILLSDDADTVSKKVMKMYTDPNRLRADDPGTVEGNPLWTFHDTFTADREWVEKTKEQYRAGKIGDVDCKKRLIESIVSILEPMWKRRETYANDLGQIQRILKEGAEKTQSVVHDTLQSVREALHQRFH